MAQPSFDLPSPQAEGTHYSFTSLDLRCGTWFFLVSCLSDHPPVVHLHTYKDCRASAVGADLSTPPFVGMHASS